MAIFLIERGGGGSGTRDVHFITQRVWFLRPPKYCNILVRIRSVISPASRFCWTILSASLSVDKSPSLKASRLGWLREETDLLEPDLGVVAAETGVERWWEGDFSLGFFTTVFYSNIQQGESNLFLFFGWALLGVFDIVQRLLHLICHSPACEIATVLN